MNVWVDVTAVQTRSRPPRAPWQERRSSAYLALIALAVGLMLRGPLGPTVLHDSLSVYWVWADQFTVELGRGNLYPRWLAASDAGLGTPVFYYYPPLAFHLTAMFGLIGLSTYASLVAAFGSGFALSGIACWHWLRGRTNNPLIASMFFMAAPYHLLNYTDRGALAESVATALIPVLAIGLRRIAERRGGLLITAAAYAAMIGTHLPLALLVSIFLVAPYAIAHRLHFRTFSIALAGGIGLSAIYLLPALALDRFHDVAQLYRTPNLRPDYYSIFSGNWADVSYTVAVIIVAALALAAALLAVRFGDRWAILAFVVCVVVAGLVPFLWSMPLLKSVQFPYRALPIAEFAFATAIARIPRGPQTALAAAALPMIASLIVLPGFHSRARDVARLQAVHPDAYEYLPVGVLKPGQTAARLSDVLAPRVPPPRVPGEIVEPHFYFPAWSCGTEEPRTQLLMHDSRCKPRIVWTMFEKLGASISFVFAFSLLCAGVRRRFQLRLGKELRTA